MKVLIPLDGSSLADGILPHVPRVLMRAAAQLHLLRVLAPDADEESEQQAQRHLEAAVEQLVATGETEVGSSTERGEDPADTILSLAEEGGYDLIAMATHGRTGVARLVRGSVAERVLRHARIPVYMVSREGLLRDNDEVRFDRVMIALDGSPQAAKIIPLVLPFVTDSQAEVVLLHVSVPGKDSVHPVPEVAKSRAQEKAEAALDSVAEMLTTAGVEVHVLGAYGDPAEQLLEAAERQDVDLLAMTSHGRTGLSRWRFGSVAEKVLRQARCPLLIRTAPKG
ncbi:MAG TPA: hypothetical protein DEA08_33695 [Planctomycetes bacterium]|nr:hypothetical protein [Planctomycetota bacterium]